jgi:phage repressor protein C with HTH and peptisase S24 domain
MSGFSEKIMSTIRKAVDDQFNGNISAASKAWGVTGDNLNKWLSGKRVPSIKNISPIIDRLGKFVTEIEPAKDVCFVNAKVMPAGQHIAPPQSEQYIAAPLVGEVGAGPGYFAQEEVESWFLVYKNVPAIMHRRNLIAVEIGPSSTSMQPLLNPGDIVLVDRDDQDVEHPGHIMLVRDPDGAGMIKRVALNKDGDDWSLQYYSDNAAKNPPMIYRLNEDFDGDITKAVVGRVIWAWTDVRDK